jgi:hypothetical protein
VNKCERFLELGQRHPKTACFIHCDNECIATAERTDRGRNLAQMGIDATAEMAARMRRRSSWLRMGSNPQVLNNLVQRKLAVCLETGCEPRKLRTMRGGAARIRSAPRWIVTWLHELLYEHAPTPVPEGVDEDAAVFGLLEWQVRSSLLLFARLFFVFSLFTHLFYLVVLFTHSILLVTHLYSIGRARPRCARWCVGAAPAEAANRCGRAAAFSRTMPCSRSPPPPSSSASACALADRNVHRRCQRGRRDTGYQPGADEVLRTAPGSRCVPVPVVLPHGSVGAQDAVRYGTAPRVAQPQGEDVVHLDREVAASVHAVARRARRRRWRARRRGRRAHRVGGRRRLWRR